MAGLLAALLLTRLLRGTARRVTGALAFAITGGLAAAAILQFWLGSLNGTYWANSGVIALTIAATSLSILGLQALLGVRRLRSRRRRHDAHRQPPVRRLDRA